MIDKLVFVSAIICSTESLSSFDGMHPEWRRVDGSFVNGGRVESNPIMGEGLVVVSFFEIIIKNVEVGSEVA